MTPGAAPATTTVWSLELTDPARVRPPDRPPARALHVSQSDASGTSERFYRAVGASWHWTDRLGWGPERWAAWEQAVETLVGSADGEEVGYVELDSRRPGEVEIAYFGLLPGWSGRGLGGHLLTFALRRALALAPRVWVQTCSLDGPHALANYEARGLARFRTEAVLR